MIIEIPLRHLVLSRRNVRRSRADARLDQLAASIKAHGLLQALTVRPLADDSGKPTESYEVIAGGRRWLALARLTQAGEIPADWPVPCVVRTDFSATELGLAENLHLPMHPADQYEAFARLAGEGAPALDIAARFGVSEQVVRQRLRLGSLSPALLDLYREGQLNLEQAMALTVCEDPADQERVWNELLDWNRHPELIRRALTKQHVAASEPIARFVGIEAYEVDGGAVLRDLFDERRTWLTDPDRLHRLAQAKLDEAAEPVRAEGWSWVHVATEWPGDSLRSTRRVWPKRREPTAEEQAEREGLERRLRELEALADDSDADETAIGEEWERIEQRLAQLEQATHSYDADDIARAGAVLWIGREGSLTIERGFVRAEDDATAPASDPATTVTGTSGAGKACPETDQPASPPSAPEAKPIPDRLIEDLTAHKTAGLRLALAQDTETAITALTHALASRLFHRAYAYGSCLDIRTAEPYLLPSAEGIQESPAVKAFETLREQWGEHLPDTAEGLWTWMAAADQQTRLDLLAFCAAASVNAIRKAGRYESCGGTPTRWAAHPDRLAALARLDMRGCWQPSRERYLGRIAKRHILEALAEVAPRKAKALDGLKKDALIEAAEPILTKARWLPDILRTQSGDGEAPSESAAGEAPADPGYAIAAE